jgi:hypothetical protein
MSLMDYEINGRDEESTRGISRDFEEEFFIFEDRDDRMDETAAPEGAALVEDRSSGPALGSPDEEDRYELSTRECDGFSSSGSTNSDSEEDDLRWDSILEELQFITESNTERP